MIVQKSHNSESGKIEVLYVKFSSAPISNTVEIFSDGILVAFTDLGQDGKLIGIEFLTPELILGEQ